MEGKAFGRYRVTRKIAQGSMGEVYAAVHELMHMDAVVKVLRPEMSTDASAVRRFFNEAQAAARIRHPGIVSIFDLGYEAGDQAYIVTERLRGETLQRRLQRVGRLPVAQALALVRQILETLDATHACGIMHQDLQPANLFLVSDPEVAGGERVKVLDFGLPRLMDAQDTPRTRTGTVFGTPSYMAPEQCMDATVVDERADLYAVGCLLYACLCGAPPFTGARDDVLAAQRHTAPTAPRHLRPDLPPGLDELVMALLQKHREDRPGSCKEVLRMLDAVNAGMPAAERGEAGAGAAGAGAGTDDAVPAAAPEISSSQTSSAVPIFQEPERCQLIDERRHDTNSEAQAEHRCAQKHTIPGLPFHFRPPGPCRASGRHDAAEGACMATTGHGERAGTCRAEDQILGLWLAGKEAPAGPDASRPERAGTDAGMGRRTDGPWGTGPQEVAPATTLLRATTAPPDTLCSIAAGAAQIYWPERIEPRRRHVRAGIVALVVLGALGYGLLTGPSAHDRSRPAASAKVVEPRAAHDQAAHDRAAHDRAAHDQVAQDETMPGAPGTLDRVSLQCLHQAREAMDSAQWERAMMLAHQAQALSQDEPVRMQAAELEDLARREHRSQERFEQIQAAITRGDVATAATRLSEIPESSAYRARALDLTRTAWTRAQMREAEALVAAGRCAELDPIAARIRHVSAQASAAVEAMRADCDPAMESTRASQAGDADSAQPLARQAMHAYRTKQYRRAHRLCRKALDTRPDDQGLLAVCSLAACQLQREAAARRYYEKAAPAHRPQIARGCEQAGFDIAAAGR